MKTAREVASELIESVRYEVIDNVYRLIKKNYVKDDVAARLEEEFTSEVEAYSLTDEDIKNLIDAVAEDYVFEGKYDCNQSYWSNIDLLINEYLRKE